MTLFLLAKQETWWRSTCIGCEKTAGNKKGKLLKIANYTKMQERKANCMMFRTLRNGHYCGEMLQGITMNVWNVLFIL